MAIIFAGSRSGAETTPLAYCNPIWDPYRHYTMQATYRDHRKHVIHKVGFIHNSVK